VRVRAGGGQAAVLWRKPLQVHAMLPMGSRLLFADSASKQIVSLEGTPGKATTVATDQAIPTGLMADGAHLYWVAHNPQAGVRVLRRAPLPWASPPGGPMETLATLAPSGELVGMAGDVLYVFIAASRDGQRGRQLATVPKDGGTPVAIELGQVQPTKSAVVGEQELFFADQQKLYRAPKEGGEPTVIDRARNVRHITLGGDQLYYAVLGEGLFAVDLKGGGPRRLAGGRHLTGIALDSHHVYWADAADRTVKRLPRSGAEPH